MSYTILVGEYYDISIETQQKKSENKTIRFPLSLIEQIEAQIEGRDVSFSSFVIQACEYAINELNNNANNND